MHWSTPLALVTLTLSACASLEGPPADLHRLATPDPTPPAVRTVVQTTPGPTPGPGRWRAWLPPQRTPNGDVVEGHWLELSTEPPVIETLEPVQPLPRAPKVTFGKVQPPLQAPPPPPVAPAIVVPPQPVLPDGLSGVHRGVRTPSTRPPLGGS